MNKWIVIRTYLVLICSTIIHSCFQVSQSEIRCVLLSESDHWGGLWSNKRSMQKLNVQGKVTLDSRCMCVVMKHFVKCPSDVVCTHSNVNVEILTPV